MGERKLTVNTRREIPQQPSHVLQSLSIKMEFLDAKGDARAMEEQPNRIRYASRVLDQIRALPEDEVLVLLTPVVPPPPPPPAAPSRGDSNNSSITEMQNMDPFECLGRAISLHHKRVRHVPYLPTIGLTDAHATIMHLAAAIVVVVCDVPDPAAQAKGFGYEDQAQVAKTVLDGESQTRDVHVHAHAHASASSPPSSAANQTANRTTTTTTIPVLGVLVTSRLRTVEKDWNAWDSLIHTTSYMPSVMRSVGDLLFQL